MPYLTKQDGRIGYVSDGQFVDLAEGMQVSNTDLFPHGLVLVGGRLFHTQFWEEAPFVEGEPIELSPRFPLAYDIGEMQAAYWGD